MWPFKRKAPAAPRASILHFRDGPAFFDYLCQFGLTTIEPPRPIPAIVLDAAKEFGTSAAVAVKEDGVQLAMVRVASPDGGFVVPAHTASSRGRSLKPGDIVLWAPLRSFRPISDDPRSAWIGVIISLVATEIDPASPRYRILDSYTA